MGLIGLAQQFRQEAVPQATDPGQPGRRPPGTFPLGTQGKEGCFYFHHWAPRPFSLVSALPSPGLGFSSEDTPEEEGKRDFSNWHWR